MRVLSPVHHHSLHEVDDIHWDRSTLDACIDSAIVSCYCKIEYYMNIILIFAAFIWMVCSVMSIIAAGRFETTLHKQLKLKTKFKLNL